MKNNLPKLPIRPGCIPMFFTAVNVTAAPAEIQILPFGLVISQTYGPFLNDDQAMQETIGAFSVKVNDLVIDYEHQTLYGEVAPAAGWIKELINKGQEGLWARVEWTEKAKQMVEGKEYRYLSPVVWVRASDGRAIEIHSAALTNTPAIDGMIPIINSTTNKPFAWVPTEHLRTEDPTKHKGADTLKNLVALKAKLGLPETATEEQILAAVDALAESGKTIVANKDVLTLLDLGESATLDETKGKIIALKNPAGYVSREEYNNLKKRLDDKDRDDLVQLAINSGKITPAQKAWAEETALKDPAGFRAFINSAPVVVPLDQLNLGSGEKKKAISTDAELAINKQLGVSKELVDKYNQEQ